MILWIADCGLRIATLLAAATLIGCSWTPEQPILDQFFAASRLRDNTTLAVFAAIAFEPATQGIVTVFDITSVTPEQRKPLALKALAKAHEDAEAEREKGKLASESMVVDMSVNTGATRIDVAKYDGEMISKDVSVSAPVRLPNGQTAQKNLVVTMQRAVLKGDRDITGRWIITAIKDASGPASTPRS